MAAPVPSQTRATQLIASLGEAINIPVVDLTGSNYQLPTELGNPLYSVIERHSVEKLTTGVIDGTGAFDRIMSSLKEHLKDQYERGLITGDQYTKAYIEMTNLALNAAVQFMTAVEQSYWQNALVQQQARRAEVETVTARVLLDTQKMQYAAAAAQKEILEVQLVQGKLGIANEDMRYEVTHAQMELVNEQRESARAQTLNTRTDGSAVVGVMGKQRDLYTQQIDSFQKDAAYKVGKMYLDSWLTQKTIDEGLTPPTELTNVNVNTVLGRLRNGVALT